MPNLSRIGFPKTSIWWCCMLRVRDPKGRLAPDLREQGFCDHRDRNVFVPEQAERLPDAVFQL
jgi:hypothetical protein